MASPAIKPEPTDTRLVLLIRKSERRRLEKLAKAEKVSIAEIVRRSLGTYRSMEATLRKKQEEELLCSILRVIDESLSGVNESIAATSKRLDRLHLELGKRKIA